MFASVIGFRANATAIPVPSSRRSVCSAAIDEREERVVVRLGGERPRRSRPPRAPWPPARSPRSRRPGSRRRPSWPRCLASCTRPAERRPTVRVIRTGSDAWTRERPERVRRQGGGPRRCHTPPVPCDAWAVRCRTRCRRARSRRSRSARSRSGSPTSTGSRSRRRRAASKGTLVHRALELLMCRPADDRTLDAALADLDRARAELADDPEFAELELTEEEWARSTPTPRRSSAATSSSRTPPTVHPIGLELQARRPIVGTRAHPRHHRPARARRRRRARRHRLQDRRACRRSASRARASAACTSTRCCASRCSAGGRRACSSSTCRSPRRSSPSRPSRSVSRRRTARRPRCGRRSSGRARATTSGPTRAACATSARSSRTARRTAAIPSRPPSCRGPGTVIEPALPLATA